MNVDEKSIFIHFIDALCVSRTGGSSRWLKVLPIMGIKRPRPGNLVMRLNLNPWIHDDYKNGPVNSL